jgi:hypothetical protein
MNKKNSRIFKFAAITGWAVLAGINAYADDSALVSQPDFPKIIYQPEDQVVYVGSNATFVVRAANTDGYQWFRNGNPINGQTNASLTITNAGIKDVGYYSCNLFKDIEVVPTRAANLMLYTSSIDPQTGVDPIVVFGFPLFGGGGQGTCPGHYTGYINYTKTTQLGWGWAPDTSNGNITFTVSDTNRPDTKIQYGGMYGDIGCNQTGVTVPSPAISPAYRFTIYFTNNVPTNAYPITLDGFKP